MPINVASCNEIGARLFEIDEDSSDLFIDKLPSLIWKV